MKIFYILLIISTLSAKKGEKIPLYDEWLFAHTSETCYKYMQLREYQLYQLVDNYALYSCYGLETIIALQIKDIDKEYLFEGAFLMNSVDTIMEINKGQITTLNGFTKKVIFYKGWLE